MTFDELVGRYEADLQRLEENASLLHAEAEALMDNATAEQRDVNLDECSRLDYILDELQTIRPKIRAAKTRLSDAILAREQEAAIDRAAGVS